MDMFIKLFDVESQEFIYINKNIMETISIDMVKSSVGVVISGEDPCRMHIKLQNTSDVHEFMKAVEGMVYNVPKVKIVMKSII
jgi:hypothetical protein